MKPKKYPYSGRQGLTRTGLPRFIQLGNIAIDSKLINNAYEEKQIMVQLKLGQVLKILNSY